MAHPDVERLRPTPEFPDCRRSVLALRALGVRRVQPWTTCRFGPQGRKRFQSLVESKRPRRIVMAIERRSRPGPETPRDARGDIDPYGRQVKAG